MYAYAAESICTYSWIYINIHKNCPCCNGNNRDPGEEKVSGGSHNNISCHIDICQVTGSRSLLYSRVASRSLASGLYNWGHFRDCFVCVVCMWTLTWFWGLYPGCWRSCLVTAILPAANYMHLAGPLTHSISLTVQLICEIQYIGLTLYQRRDNTASSWNLRHGRLKQNILMSASSVTFKTT